MSNTLAGRVPAATPELFALRRTQDDVLDLRQRLLPVLQEGLVLNGESAATRCCFGLVNTTDNELEKRLAAHKASVDKMLDELRRHSMGQLNPNLLRLHLAMPDGTRTAEELVDTFLKKASRRACQRDPNADECMSNRQLTAIQNCVPEQPGVWELTDTCRRAKTAA